jgi:hypothetical protein
MWLLQRDLVIEVVLALISVLLTGALLMASNIAP